MARGTSAVDGFSRADTIESCRRRGIDSYAYLRDVLTRLPHATNWRIKDLTPEAWAKAQRSASLAAAA